MKWNFSTGLLILSTVIIVSCKDKKTEEPETQVSLITRTPWETVYGINTAWQNDSVIWTSTDSIKIILDFNTDYTVRIDYPGEESDTVATWSLLNNVLIVSTGDPLEVESLTREEMILRAENTSISPPGAPIQTLYRLFLVASGGSKRGQ